MSARRRCLLVLLLLLLAVRPQDTGAAGFPVGIVASDDPELSAPVDRDQPLTTDQIYQMTARAMALIGGMGVIVPDTAKTVLIKPNISIARPSGSGVVTDARVVRAVALLVHEVAPQARILIAEGAGGWISPALADCSLVQTFYGDDRILDGFEIAGHRQTVAELRRLGVDIDVHDLNFDPVYTRQVPGGGLLWDEYDLAASVLDADVWINVPVAKTHGAKITCSLKNHFGILPGVAYGWNKARGTDTHRAAPHWPRTMDEAWVDLVLLSRVDLNVVDLIRGTEGGAFEGTPKRSNLIVAGADPIATDLVVAQLMGFNPDDFEFADLGAQRGIGPGSIDHVDVRGGGPMALRSRFAKASVSYEGDWAEHAQYGMGPRRWTLLGPLERDHTFTPEELASLAPVPGQEGWSEVVWFGFDKIDLDTHFDDPVQKVVYAFTYFTMATSDSVRFWIGSDEGLTVWIDGERIYRHQGRRRHTLGGDKLPGYVAAGTHRLLIRAEQGRGRFDFSFNVCEPIDDLRYAGNRYPGVRYDPRGGGGPLGQVQVWARQAWDPWRKGGIEQTLDTPVDPVVAFRLAPDSLWIEAPAARTTALLEVIAAQVPGVAVWAEQDRVTPTVLSQLPFAMAHMGLGKEWWTPAQPVSLRRLLSWAGVSYWLSFGNGDIESSKAIAGWLSLGRVPLTGFDDGWVQVNGYRKQGRGAAIHSLRPDTTLWHEVGRGLWGRLPGRDWLEMPVLVVEATGPPLGYDAWVDSAATVALAFARQARAEQVEDWGTRGAPAGLAAWDAFVIDWERQPWTPEWARSQASDILARMGRGFYDGFAREHEQVGRFFSLAAQASQGDRRTLLARSADGYDAAGGALRAIHEGLPRPRPGGGPSEEGSWQESIGDLKPLARQARAGERQALAALAELLQDGPLPPVQEDPLGRRDRGRVLCRWQAGFSKGIYDLTLAGRSLTRTHLGGREPEEEEVDVQHAARHEQGWQVALDVADGEGFYEVSQQPSAANGWVTVIRVDDEWTGYDNATELVVWEVPAP